MKQYSAAHPFQEKEKTNMAFEKAFPYLSDRGYADRVQTFQVSSATVELETLCGGIWVDVCVPMAEKQQNNLDLGKKGGIMTLIR